jgi:hypothetical protein
MVFVSAIEQFLWAVVDGFFFNRFGGWKSKGETYGIPTLW